MTGRNGGGEILVCKTGAAARVPTTEQTYLKPFTVVIVHRCTAAKHLQEHGSDEDGTTWCSSDDTKSICDTSLHARSRTAPVFGFVLKRSGCLFPPPPPWPRTPPPPPRTCPLSTRRLHARLDSVPKYYTYAPFKTL